MDWPEQIVATQLTASADLKTGPNCINADIQIDGTVSGGTLNVLWIFTKL